jgi:hypothetical protein
VNAKLWNARGVVESTLHPSSGVHTLHMHSLTHTYTHMHSRTYTLHMHTYYTCTHIHTHTYTLTTHIYYTRHALTHIHTTHALTHTHTHYTYPHSHILFTLLTMHHVCVYVSRGSASMAFQSVRHCTSEHSTCVGNVGECIIILLLTHLLTPSLTHLLTYCPGHSLE